MDLFGAGAALQLSCLPISHFQRTQSKERWGQGWDERCRSSREREEWGDQEGKEKGRRREKEKTGDRFWRSCVLPYCDRSVGSIAKKWRGVPGVTGNLGKANSHFDPTQTSTWWSGTAPPRWGGSWLVKANDSRYRLYNKGIFGNNFSNIGQFQSSEPLYINKRLSKCSKIRFCRRHIWYLSSRCWM